MPLIIEELRMKSHHERVISYSALIVSLTVLAAMIIFGAR